MGSTGLTPDQLSFFKDNGYLVIPSFLSQDETSHLLSTASNLLTTFDISTHPLTKFTTGDHAGGDEKTHEKHVGDEYFLTSGDKVRYFFEPDAFDKTTGNLRLPQHLAINKIGHSLHTLSQPFKEATLSSQNAAIARDLGFKDPRVLQSMVICKQPSIGGAVPPHKDSEFLYTDPPSAVGWWIALENATVENGGLGFWKGSHKRSPVRRRFVRRTADQGGGTDFISWNDSDGSGLPREFGKIPHGKPLAHEEKQEQEQGQGQELEQDYVPQEKDFELIEVPAGGLVLIHGNVLHASQKNTSGKSRFAYAFHAIEGGDEHVYDERNWLQPPEGGFSSLTHSAT